MADRFDELSARTKAEFPRFNVRERDKSWLRWIFGPLSKILGQDYSTFTTTIFSTMYVGAGWQHDTPNEKYQTLRHEMQHIDQFHHWPLGRRLWPVNHVIMAFCYLFVLPLFWTLRARFERAGYTQTLLVEFELHGAFSQDRMESNARWMAETFGGGSYFYMWRRKAAYAWAMETQRKILAGEITNPKDRVLLPADAPAPVLVPPAG